MKELKDYTITELKALKSDIYENIQANQSNLSIINNELLRREKEVPTQKDVNETHKSKDNAGKKADTK